MNDIARNFKTARRKSGMTQEQAALKLGCSFHSINRWENGRACPSFNDAIQLSILYDVPLDELAYGETRDF